MSKRRCHLNLKRGNRSQSGSSGPQTKAHPRACTLLCTDMLICTQSTFHFCLKPLSENGKHKKSSRGNIFPNPPFSSLPSISLSTLHQPNTHNTPNPCSHFCLSGKARFISLVEILDCQSDQLPVSRALHGSSNYNPVQLARAHVAVGQPL